MSDFNESMTYKSRTKQDTKDISQSRRCLKARCFSVFLAYKCKKNTLNTCYNMHLFLTVKQTQQAAIKTGTFSDFAPSVKAWSAINNKQSVQFSYIQIHQKPQWRKLLNACQPWQGFELFSWFTAHKVNQKTVVQPQSLHRDYTNSGIISEKHVIDLIQF